MEFECGLIPVALVQNKIDLYNRSVVSREEVERFAFVYKVKVFQTSVKDNFNVDNSKSNN